MIAKNIYIYLINILNLLKNFQWDVYFLNSITKLVYVLHVGY